MHLIVLGRVKLALLAPAGAEKVVEILGPGQSFGESVMFMGRPHTLYAEALAESLLLHIGKHAILEAVARNPEFARRMLDELSQRLCRLVVDIEAYTLKSATERVPVICWRHSTITTPRGKPPMSCSRRAKACSRPGSTSRASIFRASCTSCRKPG